MSARLVLGVTLGLVSVPVLVDLFVSDKRRPFGYAAADTFYYLVVARNVGRHGSFSFDGQHATNGFHPVWQVLTGVLAFLTERLGRGDRLLLLAIVASLLLVTSGVALVGACLSEERRLTPLFVVLPVGLYGFAISPFWIAHLGNMNDPSQTLEGPFPVYGTLWSYANGMESGAVIFAFGLCAFLHRAWSRAPTLGRSAWYGLALALLTLSRLDHVFIALSLLVEFALAAHLRRRPWRESFATLGAFGLPVAIDVFVNVHWFGAAMPISGALKTSFPLVTPVHIQSWIDTFKLGRGYNLWILQREASLVVPALFALAYIALTLRPTWSGSALVLEFRKSTRRYESFLLATAIGILVLASYNILFLTDGPGSWYAPVSTLFVSLALIAVVDRSAHSLAPAGAGVLVAALALASVGFFLKLHRHVNYNHTYADFDLREAPSVRQHFHGQPPRFVEFDDGIVSYALDTPAMSAGLALDPEGLAAARANNLFTLAYERGFRCIASLVYISAARLLSDASPAAAREYAQARLGNEDFSSYDFKTAFVTQSGSLAVVCGQKR